MSFEIYHAFSDDKFRRGVFLEKYKDEFYIIAGYCGKSAYSTPCKKWGFPQDKDGRPISVAIPWGISLGVSPEAITILKRFLKELEGKNEH